MQKKLALLALATMCLVGFNQAQAQTVSNDKLEIVSPDGNFKIGFRGKLQENLKFSYTKAGEKKELDLELTSARFLIHGHVFDPSLSYLFQVGFEAEKGPEPREERKLGSHLLKDYYLNKAFYKRHLQLRVGKFITPLSRQQLMVDNWQQDRASHWYSDKSSGRDVGIMVHNGHHHPIEWALAAVSTGLVGRLGYNYNGIDGYDAVDWHGGGLRFGVAANGFVGTDYMTANFLRFKAGADFIVKKSHFAANGGFYWKQTKENKGADAINGMGAGLDLGYLINARFEPTARYSWYQEAKDHPNNHEILAGLNYYAFAHHLKVQGYGGVRLADKDWTKWMVGVQVQLAI